ncbi:MAG: helix-turn-helix domain-containing protein [Paracoccaceae bacterium]
MKHAVRGRIVLWQGASLWAFDVRPGTSGGRKTHSHHAIQLTFSLGGTFSFDVAGGNVPGPAVLIAPDVPHAYIPEGRNGMIFFEPESRAGEAILRRLAGREVARVGLEDLGDAEARLSCIWGDPRPDGATLAALGQELVARFAGGNGPAPGIDRRIARVLDALAAPDRTGPDVAEAAGIACLSESRFSHLFVREVGLQFRTYMLWRRLMRAVDGIAAGASLTEAAHDAGFADSAHFSRTFLRMFGVPASLLLLS